MHIKIIYTKPGMGGFTKAEMFACFVPFFGKPGEIRKAVKMWEKFSGNTALVWTTI